MPWCPGQQVHGSHVIFLGSGTNFNRAKSDSGSTRRPQATAQLVASVEHKHLRRSRTFLWEKRSPEGRRGKDREKRSEDAGHITDNFEKTKNSQPWTLYRPQKFARVHQSITTARQFFPWAPCRPRETAGWPSAPPCPVLAFSLSLRLERLSSGCRCEDAPDEVDEEFEAKNKLVCLQKATHTQGTCSACPFASRPEDVYPSLRLFLTNLHPPLLADLLRPSRVLSVSSGCVNEQTKKRQNTTDGAWEYFEVRGTPSLCRPPFFGYFFASENPKQGKQEREPAFSGSKRGDHGAGYDIVHER